MTIPHSKLRSAARKLWLWSDARRAALKAAKVGPGLWWCFTCGIHTKKPEVDHIYRAGSTPGAKGAPVGATWDEFYRRLFCPASELRILCKSCHLQVTQAQRQEATAKKAPAA